MRFVVALAAALPAISCSFDSSGLALDGGAGEQTDAEIADAGALADASPGDADPTGEDASACEDALPFEPLNFTACDVPPPEHELDLGEGEWELDTGSGELRQDGEVVETLPRAELSQPRGLELAIVSVESMRIRGDAVVRGVGDAPLALVALGDLEVDGTLSLAGQGNVPGPGADLDCGTGGEGSPGEEQSSGGVTGGSGGGGGGFGTPGGEGGAVDGSGDDRTPGGEDNGSSDLEPLRGGCSGGEGGVAGGEGGGGGGALQLVARGEVRIDGAVSAAGGGGRGPTGANSGGGGGGSGGAILIQGDRVLIPGAVTAGGGGGAEGTRGGTSADPGSDGLEDDAEPAEGGAGASAGGDGGDGAALGVSARDGDEGSSGSIFDPPGGGGGGGGAGRIRIVAIELLDIDDATISPAPEVEDGAGAPAGGR